MSYEVTIRDKKTGDFRLYDNVSNYAAVLIEDKPDEWLAHPLSDVGRGAPAGLLLHKLVALKDELLAGREPAVAYLTHALALALDECGIDPDEFVGLLKNE